MFLLDLLSDYSLLTLLLLSLFAFAAGFIDAAVGGGGLIQLPALLIQFHDTPLPTLFGTNKIAALSGTSVAAYQYSKRIKYNFRLLIVISMSAFVASYLGANAVSHLKTDDSRGLIEGTKNDAAFVFNGQNVLSLVDLKTNASVCQNL